MWFIADIFERYTTNIAKAFMRITMTEAEATRRAVGGRGDAMEPAKDKAAAAAMAAQPSAEVLASARIRERAMKCVGGDAAAAAASRSIASAAAPQRPADESAMPMGVRADVVVKWVQIFAHGERRHMAELLEKLRKDKKVRVAELQFICAEVLGETPQNRQKGEHLDVLRRHFAPAERTRAPAPAEAQLSVN